MKQNQFGNIVTPVACGWEGQCYRFSLEHFGWGSEAKKNEKDSLSDSPKI